MIGRAVQTTAPSGAVVTTSEAKTQLRVTHSNDDTFIDSLISAATDYAESYTNRQFYTATWKYYLDTFPSGCIELPHGSVQSVTSVKYYDTNGTEQTWAASNYDTATEGPIGRIHAVSAWPTTDTDTLHAVTVEYVSGYGTAGSIPDGIKQAILLLVGHWYRNREAVVVGSINSNLKLAVGALLDKYKIYYWGD